jgi:hypothetical protein
VWNGNARRFHARPRDWEVHFRLDHAVEVVEENVQGDVGDDLDDLRVGEPGFDKRLEVLVTDLAALKDDGLGEA